MVKTHRGMFTRLLALLLLHFIAASACAVEPNLKQQQLVQIAVTDIPFSLSPYSVNASSVLDDQYNHLFFDPLVRWGKERVLQYRLLKKLTTLENGNLRFYLKDDIYFHSGNPLTSEDVIWSFKEAMSNKYLQRKLQHRIKMTQVNEKQFDIETQLTQAQLLDYLTHLFILDRRYYKTHNISYNFVQSAIYSSEETLPLSGTGPYRVASFSPGLKLRVRASDNYWQAKPMFSNLNFLKIKSTDSRLYALLADDVDISESISNKNINSLHVLDNKDIYQKAPLNALFLTINEQNHPSLQRQSVRNAIHLAINQMGILEHILNGTGTVDNTFKLTRAAVSPPEYDAPRSKYLLKKMGAPTQLSLLLMSDKFSQTDEIIFALKNMFQKVGIELEVTEVTTVEEWDELQFSADLTLSPWLSGLIEKSNVYQDIFSSSLISDYVANLFFEEKSRLTMQEKIDYFEQYQLSDKVIPLFSKNKIWATDKKFNLENMFSVNAIPYWHLLNSNKLVAAKH